MNWKATVYRWDVITPELIKFFLAQAESYLKQTMDVHDKLTARSFNLLTMLIPAITITVGVLLNSNAVVSAKLIAVCYTALVCSVACTVMLTFIILPRNWMAIGRMPKELISDQIIQSTIELQADQRFVGLVLNELENIQMKIEYNERSNYRRQNMLRLVVILMALAFVGITVTLLAV